MRRCVDGEGKHLTRCSRQLSLVKQYMSVQSHLSLITKPNDGCRLTKRPGYGLEVWWRLESLARVASQPDEMDARCVASSRGGLLPGLSCVLVVCFPGLHLLGGGDGQEVGRSTAARRLHDVPRPTS